MECFVSGTLKLEREIQKFWKYGGKGGGGGGRRQNLQFWWGEYLCSKRLMLVFSHKMFPNMVVVGEGLIMHIHLLAQKRFQNIGTMIVHLEFGTCNLWCICV